MIMDIEPTITFFEKLVATGAVPPNVVRFVVDSGGPDTVPRIFWECFATKGFLDVLVDEMRVRIGPPTEAETADIREMRKSYRQILIQRKEALERKIKETEGWDE